MSRDGSKILSLVIGLQLTNFVLLDGTTYQLQLNWIQNQCLPYRNLQFYKLYAHTYGGESNGNIQGRHEHTETEQKFISLFYLMISSFKGARRALCNLCDSAYVVDIIALIVEIWYFQIARGKQVNTRNLFQHGINACNVPFNLKHLHIFVKNRQFTVCEP